MRSRPNVLIVAGEPMLAALLGGLVDALRLRPVYPLAHESAEMALARARPLAVILLESSSDAAGSELFVVRARRRGAQVMVFGDAAAVQALRARAQQMAVTTFILPDELDRLQFALDATAREARGGTHDRRRQVRRAAEGAASFDDAAGRRWQFYDRRSGDRRAGLTREFVSEDGERRVCEIGVGDAGAFSTQELRAQLARSTPDGTSR